MKTRANILWPATIIGLLALSGVTTFAVLIASRSDGGAQVVDNYYRKSVAWDSLSAIRQAGARLGWKVRVEIVGGSTRAAIASFSDSTGSPIVGLTGSVTVTRPQSAITFGTHGLTAEETSAGRYVFEFPYSEPGLWDLDVVATRGSEQFLERVRIEI